MAFFPFSILDTRSKEWKLKKKYWIDKFNIKSELGRENIKSKSGFWETPDYTSVFDPTLCQNIYEWFCPAGGKILDPFAGGSVRGIVAEEMGFSYTGIDISEKQILANRLQSKKPNWIIGDSLTVVGDLNTNYDFIFTCPPYHNLEVYSDNPRDISTQSYDEFIESLKTILISSAKKLKNNRFIGIVVSEIREQSTTRNYKIGKYKGFVSDIIKFMGDHNLYFYNDIVLFNSQHQASRTSKIYFERNRKVASIHQNVLIFIKGNPDLAAIDITWDGTYTCTINGVRYKTFREASISINHDKLGVSEVVRRCNSSKSKYKNWQVIGKETRPIIKYIVDGIPFESSGQIADAIGGDFTESMARNRVYSTNKRYRHFKLNSTNEFNRISYDEMNQLQQNDIRLQLPIIKCENIDFYSLQDAANYFNISSERIRQKLKDRKFSDYTYLYGEAI